MANYSYNFKVSGKFADGTSMSKTFSKIDGNFCAAQNIADNFATAYVKLFDTGTTVTSVDKISHKEFETSATA